MLLMHKLKMLVTILRQDYFCVKKKNKLSAQYSLKNINSPIAIAEYKYLEELPNYLNKKLENIEEKEHKN